MNLRTIIRLKTVIMSHNLNGVADVARFAQEHGLEVFYQPVEQNYNTPDDPHWFEHSPTWPRDPAAAVAVVNELISLKQQGLPIANSERQLEVMIPYFRDPRASMIVTQSHIAHRAALCSALTDLQIQADGDIKSCWHEPAIGNMKTTSLRAAWNARPRRWESGCCMVARMADAERAAVAVQV